MKILIICYSLFILPMLHPQGVLPNSKIEGLEKYVEVVGLVGKLWGQCGCSGSCSFNSLFRVGGEGPGVMGKARFVNIKKNSRCGVAPIGGTSSVPKEIWQLILFSFYHWNPFSSMGRISCDKVKNFQYRGGSTIRGTIVEMLVAGI